MIHLALVVAAILFLGIVALTLLGIIFSSFTVHKGFGCIVTVLVAIGVLVVLAIAL